MRDQAVTVLDNEDLAALRETIKIVCAEVSPSAAVHAYINDATPLDRRLWEQAAELGWLGMVAPDRVGGLSLGASGIAMLAGELGRVVAPGAILPALTTAYVLAGLPAERRVDQWLHRLIGGQVGAAIPATLVPPPACRLAAGALEGCITAWGDTANGLMLVPLGDALAVVELADQASRQEAVWDRGRHLATLDLTGLVPAMVVQDGGEASSWLTAGLAVALAGEALGTAQAALEKTIVYLNERRQFGRPVGANQAIKHRVADHATLLLTAGHLVVQAVEALDGGQPAGTMWALLAKAGAADAAAQVTGDCVQLHGGVGFTWEYDMHLHLNRARLDEMLLGTSAAVRDVAAVMLAQSCRTGETVLDLAAA